MTLVRIAVLAVALLAGGAAAMLVGGGPDPAPETKVVEAAHAEVLVAAKDISLGQILASSDLQWRAWPESGTSGFMSRKAQPKALDEAVGSIARQRIVAGEPVTAQKIVKSEGSGVMSAILPSGMRAIATEISAETGAGGFILPNDRVDVILTRKDENNGDKMISSTLLTNVRVLAIDQAISEKDGQKVVVGRTATLELLPRQTEILALARQMGTLSLTLRALVDAKPAGLAGSGPEEGDVGTTSGMTVIRYGIPTNTMDR